MNVKKKIMISVISVIVLSVFLHLAELVLIPKYTDIPEGRLVSEYYGNEGGYDVLFVGDCEVYENFSTVTLWEEYGISSYIRGSAQQLIWQSYYLLREMFETEKPQAVVFNVLSMKYGEPQNEAYNRMTIDGMKLSSDKLECIKASMTDGESLWSYIFPILRFHSRWSELTDKDFTYMFGNSEKVSYNGYLMQKGIVPVTEEQKGELIYVDPIPQICFDYLDKMRELCEANGAELILIKSPTNSTKYWWYDTWDGQITEYARKNGLDYYNMTDKCDEIGIDWQTATYDGGLHLNVYGAEKTAAYFGKILSEKYNITDRSNDSTYSAKWQDICERYYNERNKAEDKIQ